VADRVRAAPARKRSGARRPPRKKRTRRLGILGLALLVALILGFLAKRVMIPSAVHYIAYRPPDRPMSKSEANSPALPDQDDSAASNVKSDANGGPSSERLTPGDRRELNAIIKQKGR
jgi:hypothetical protein